MILMRITKPSTEDKFNKILYLRVMKNIKITVLRDLVEYSIFASLVGIPKRTI